MKFTTESIMAYVGYPGTDAKRLHPEHVRQIDHAAARDAMLRAEIDYYRHAGEMLLSGRDAELAAEIGCS